MPKLSGFEWAKKITDEIIKDLQKVEEASMKEFIKSLQPTAESIFTSVVDDFYNDYEPHLYKRTHSLYDIFNADIVDDGYGLRTWFSPEDMTPFRSGYRGETGLYTYVFRRGWHGGARRTTSDSQIKLADTALSRHRKTMLPFRTLYDAGKPYWRYPHPYYSKWAKYPAPIYSPSPRDQYNAMVDEYSEKRLNADLIKITQKNINAYVQSVDLNKLASR